MSKPEVVVIAGGRWQVPLIKFLKHRGYRVSVVDPYPTSPGVLLADHWYESDVRDSEQIYTLLRDKNLRFITSDQSDISVDAVSIVSNRLGLTTNSLDVVIKFTNKYVSREFARNNGINVPDFYKISSVEEFQEKIDSKNLPYIIKPVDSQSSRGICKIDYYNYDAISKAIDEALKHTKTNYVIAERFVSGRELTAEGVCSDFKHTTIALSLKKHFRTGIASELLYPAPVPDSVKEKICFYNDLYVNASGLQFGTTHAEYLWDESSNEVFLVEIACRGGGSLIGSHISKWVSGVDVQEVLLSNLEGSPMKVDANAILSRSAILYFFEFPQGKVDSINGLDEARKIPGVLELDLEFGPGDEIKNAADDRSRQGFVIIFSESQQQLFESLDRVKATISIKYVTDVGV